MIEDGEAIFPENGRYDATEKFRQIEARRRMGGGYVN